MERHSFGIKLSERSFEYQKLKLYFGEKISEDLDKIPEMKIFIDIVILGLKEFINTIDLSVFATLYLSRDIYDPSYKRIKLYLELGDIDRSLKKRLRESAINIIYDFLKKSSYRNKSFFKDYKERFFIKTDIF